MNLLTGWAEQEVYCTWFWVISYRQNSLRSVLNYRELDFLLSGAASISHLIYDLFSIMIPPHCELDYVGKL